MLVCREDEPEFVEWGYGGMGSVKTAAAVGADNKWARVQGSSSLGVGARTRQMRTWPSREAVATRWYERPQLGAHATLVIANVFGAVPGSAPYTSLPDGASASLDSLQHGGLWAASRNESDTDHGLRS